MNFYDYQREQENIHNYCLIVCLNLKQISKDVFIIN